MLVGIYVALVVLSQLSQLFWPDVVTPRVERESVEVGGKRLTYLEWGGENKKLDPIILLHGSPSFGATEFEAMASELAKDGRRVIAIDRWGFGGSEEWVEDYSFEAQGAAVLGLMNQLGIHTAHLGGWSYSAVLAQLLFGDDLLQLDDGADGDGVAGAKYMGGGGRKGFTGYMAGRGFLSYGL